MACIGEHWYGGTDPIILRRLAELGQSSACDHPPEDIPVVVRNHVRFSFPAEAATTAAAAVLAVLQSSSHGHGECTVAVHGDATRASFEHNHSAKYATPRRYSIERLDAPASCPTPSSREADPPPSWLLVVETQHHPIRLVDHLAQVGATNLCWFSRDEWLAAADGRHLPY